MTKTILSHSNYVILILIAIVSVCNTCDAIRKPDMKIIGGRSISWDSVPFMASIISRVDRSKVRLCGGSVINSRWILTAAHCLEDMRSADVRVFTGSTKFAEGVRHDVKQLTLHEDYDGQANDIALIELINVVSFGDGKKIRLNSDWIAPGTDATLIGWGFLSTHQDPRDVPKLHAVNLHVTKCQRDSFIDMIFQDVIIVRGGDDDSTVICTSTVQGKGACVGDSGGPLISGGKQIGVVSRGAPCATGVPDIYTKVQAFVPWIEKQTGLIFRV